VDFSYNSNAIIGTLHPMSSVFRFEIKIFLTQWVDFNNLNNHTRINKYKSHSNVCNENKNENILGLMQQIK